VRDDWKGIALSIAVGVALAFLVAFTYVGLVRSTR
jgi:hypothetical protein